MAFTVIILTHNEQLALPACLASLENVDQIVVVDSGSQDSTVEIAKQAAAEVLHHPFESFGKQRQWAMQQPQIRNDWVLFLDADERATPEFLAEVAEAIETKGEYAAFDCAWKLMLYGTWLKRCDGYPRTQTRLVNKQRVSWGDWGHGQKIASAKGEIGRINEPYNHEAYIHGWEAWWQKHQKYAKQEAISAVQDDSSTDKSVGLKKFLRRLPFWPEAFWLVRYIFSGSFATEGKAGREYCWWRYRYEKLCAKLTTQAKKQVESGQEISL